MHDEFRAIGLGKPQTNKGIASSGAVVDSGCESSGEGAVLATLNWQPGKKLTLVGLCLHTRKNYTHAHTHIYIYIYIYIYTHTRICMPTNIWKLTHTCRHTYKHTYIDSCMRTCNLYNYTYMYIYL